MGGFCWALRPAPDLREEHLQRRGAGRVKSRPHMPRSARFAQGGASTQDAEFKA